MKYQSLTIVDSQNNNIVSDNTKAADLDSELENVKTIQQQTTKVTTNDPQQDNYTEGTSPNAKGGDFAVKKPLMNYEDLTDNDDVEQQSLTNFVKDNLHLSE